MNILSRYLPTDRLSRHLPTYHQMVAQVNSIHPRRIMQNLNGKLIAADRSELDQVQQKIENLAQKFEHLELQMTTMSEQDKTDYINQIVSVQLSLQKLEQIYRRIMSATIVAAIGIASWSVFLGFNHQFSAQQANSTVESSLTKPKR
ncbi:MAG: hypothetical protein F6K31_03520 [Symploca sp. SIO2G7]|nr:hypothetical protein [Symploca sp. SIO2G7]